MSRGRESCQSAVPQQKKLLEIAQADGSFSNLQQSPGHVAYHMMKKPVSLNGEEQAMTVFF